jgi:hypothetical protein
MSVGVKELRVRDRDLAREDDRLALAVGDAMSSSCRLGFFFGVGGTAATASSPPFHPSGTEAEAIVDLCRSDLCSGSNLCDARRDEVCVEDTSDLRRGTSDDLRREPVPVPPTADSPSLDRRREERPDDDGDTMDECGDISILGIEPCESCSSGVVTSDDLLRLLLLSCLDDDFRGDDSDDLDTVSDRDDISL